MDGNEIQLRDIRRKDRFFQIDNEIMDTLDGGGFGLNKEAQWLYCKMVRHANTKRRAFPSIKKMKAQYGMGFIAVKKAFKDLIDNNLIAKVKKLDGGPYIYAILEHPGFHASSSGPPQDRGVSSTGQGVSQTEHGGGLPQDTKNTNNNNINNTNTRKKKAGKPASSGSVDIFGGKERKKSTSATHVLGDEWCAYIGIKVEMLLPKDWKALGSLSKVGIDFDQLKAMSEDPKAWKSKTKDLNYLNGARASLLSGIKKAPTGRRYKTIDDLLEQEAKV